LARELGAEYHVTAVSGIGATRNYDCADPNPMPAVYDRVFLEAANSPDWDPEHTKFVPDAILVALGTNDFSPASCMRPPLNEASDAEGYATFIRELEAFIERLRGYYPAAEVFLTSSPMLNDGWPDASYTSNTDHRAALTRVAEALDEASNAGGGVHLLLADFSKTKIAGRGCGSHPNAYEHRIMAGFDSTKPADTVPAELFLNPIKQVMGW
jgi:lysophospholipase L1-like esterase